MHNFYIAGACHADGWSLYLSRLNLANRLSQPGAYRNSRIVFIALGLLLFTSLSPLRGAHLTVAWDPPEVGAAFVSSYRIHYGTLPGNLDTVVDVGAVTNYTLLSLEEGLEYALYVTCLTAWGLESEPSNTVTNLMPYAATSPPPVVSPPGPLAIEEDTVGSLTLVVSNPPPPEAPSLRAVILDQPAHGRCELDALTLRYRPDPDFFGEDRVRLLVSDGIQQSLPITIELLVEPINDAPRGLPMQLQLFAGESLEFGFDVVDPDGDPVQVEFLEPLDPSLSSNGGLRATYSAPADAVGEYWFDVLYWDGLLQSERVRVSVDVLPARAKLTWQPPAEIVYGTPLGAGQLDATANVPGTFDYQPPAGTLLPAGSQQYLFVSFTPDNPWAASATTAEVMLDVLPRPLSISARNESITYGDWPPALRIDYNGFADGESVGSLLEPPTIRTTATAESPPGEYTVVVEGAYAFDYDITHQPGTLTITPAQLTIRAEDQTVVYGQPIPPLTFVANGFVNGDTPDNLTQAPALTTAATNGSPVGTYTIDLTEAASPNYAIETQPATLTITPAPLTIRAEDQTLVYGQPIPPLTFVADGFVNGDTIDALESAPVLTTTATNGSPVGTYAIEVTGAVAANYHIAGQPGTLTITPAPLTIRADDQTVVYGQPIPTLTFVAERFVNGDTFDLLEPAPVLATTATNGSPVGTYAIEVAGAAAANYAIETQPGTLVIVSVPELVSAVVNADGQITLLLRGSPGTICSILATANWITWSHIADVVIGPDGTITYSTEMEPGTAMLFRVRVGEAGQ